MCKDWKIEDIYVGWFILDDMKHGACEEDLVISVVKYGFGKRAVFLRLKMMDRLNIVYTSQDGYLWASSSENFSIDLEGGSIYTGDEYDEIGKLENSFESASKWLWDKPVSRVESYKEFELSSETFDKIFEAKGLELKV